MTDRTNTLIRISTSATVVGIGAVAAFVSYSHILSVATAHGESGITGRLLPLTVDGLLFTASMVLLDAARRGLSAPALARFALGLGILATLAANVTHGIAHGPIGAIVSAWPAVTLVLSVELLMGMIRRARVAERSEEPFNFAPVGGTLEHPNGTAVPAVPGNGQVREVQAADAVPEPNPHHVRAARVFAEEIAAGEVPSIREIKRRMRIGQPRAGEVQAYLTGLAQS